MTIEVILAVRGDGEAGLAVALQGAPGIAVVRRCADLVEAAGAARAGIGSVVVLSEQPRLDRSVVSGMIKAGVGIVGVPSSPAAREKLLALGIPVVVEVGAPPSDVVGAVAEARSSGAVAVQEDPDSVRGRPGYGALVAVWGPTGAPGRTTIAVNLAAEAGEILGSCILVDADTYGGAVAPALGLLDESAGLAALARAGLAGTLAAEVIRRQAVTVRPGLRVVNGIARAGRWQELSTAALEPVWSALREHANLTVIDCGFGLEGGGDDPLARGGGRDDATLSALRAADLIVAVGSAEPLGLQRLVQGLSDLREAVPGREKETAVVVNRVRASVAGSRPEVAVADALARYAAVEETWVVPDDPRACDAATLAGQVLAERAPRSAARRAIRSLAEHVCRVAASQTAVASA